MERLQIVMAAALFIIAWLVLFKIKFPSRSKNSPPSPFAFPIIGHLHLLSKLHHQSLLKLSQKYGPFMLLKFGSKPTLVVSSSSAAKEVLKTHDLVFASRPRTSFSEIVFYNGADIAGAQYGEAWRNRRKICTLELFTPKRIEFFQPVRETEMSMLMLDLFKASKSKQVVNMSEKLCDFSFNVITTMIMGKRYSSSDCEDVRKEARIFHDMMLEMFSVGGGVHIGDYIPWLKWLDFNSISRMKKLHKHMDEFLQKQIDEHRAKYHLNKDFIDVMISISKQQQLSDFSMKGIILDMIAGGIETSARTVEWTLAELVQNPKAMTKVQQELDDLFKTELTINELSDLDKLEYLCAVVKETFRLHPPVPLLAPHESTKECQISQEGYTIPTKAQLLVNVYAIGRDASIWQNPLEFKPERFLGGDNNVDFRGHSFELLPFGAGRRSCPGMNLGLATVYFMLAKLLHGFEWLKISEELDMSEKFGLTICPAHPLQLMPVARIAQIR